MLNIASKLVLATSNQGKLAELQQMLAQTSISVLSLADFDSINEVEETGSTFAENAILKAVGYARQTGLPTIADDSGLEIFSLDGRPGVHSARYGGDTTFAKKIALILAEVATIHPIDRGARFVSSIAFANSDGSMIQNVDGECTGVLAESPRGNSGFGYDPIFVPDGFDQTFGELTDTIKGRISHRANAFFKIMPYIRDFYAI